MANAIYSIGYQLPSERDSIPEIVYDYRDHISEVYFAYPGTSSGRASLDPRYNDEFWEDIKILQEMEVGLTLLFNAACYGGKAVSQTLLDDCCRQVKAFDRLKAVTTTSPVIAKQLRATFPDLEIRASVNMRIGTIKAMEYLDSYFDAFYIQRDNQRNIKYLRKMSNWCKQHGKKLHLLANSGCLANCSFQSFHDNAVAHEKEIACELNIPTQFPSPCWELMNDEKNRYWVLQNTWIRPEDIHHYQPYVDTIKLASRMHHNPRLLVNAYTTGKHYGNLLDLMEPSYGPVFAPSIIDNGKFPDDWFEQTSTCSRKCDECSYCKNTFKVVNC